MSVTIPKTQGASIDIVANLEREFGHLPMAFHLFLINHDGAKPEKNIVIVDGKKSAGIERFIPANKIIPSREISYTSIPSMAPSTFGIVRPILPT
jgi:hypothetical protein